MKDWISPLILLALLIVFAGMPVRAGSQDGFVRVSPRDHRYFEISDGSPYIPIGLNMIGPPRLVAGEDEALRGMEAWLVSLSANGGNYIRVWLSNGFWDVEPAKGKAEVLQNIQVDRGPALKAESPRSIRIYDPWAGRWSEARQRRAKLTIPTLVRPAVIRIGRGTG